MTREEYAGARPGWRAWLLLGVLALVACRETAQDPVAEAAPQGIHRTFERGPVSVDLDVDRAEIGIADRLTLRITVTAAEDYQVELPSFGNQLEQFGIVDYHTTPARLVEDGKTRTERSYILEPFLSGDYTIPPMTIRFWKTGEDETQIHEIQTEDLTVHVTSLLPEDMADLTIRDIGPPRALPGNHSPAIWLAAAAGALLSAAAGLVVWRQRRKKVEVVPQTPAHELAYAELEQLIAEDLTGQDNIKLFYQRLSDILRRYIGNRFGIRAPEQTTEEFLSGLRSGTELSGKYVPLLGEFLRHCDLVKFAEHHPQPADVQMTFDTCKTFIAETAVAAPAQTSGESGT